MPAQIRAILHWPPMSGETWSGFVGALAGCPTLPGARCRGRPHLFDEQRPDEPADTVQARHTQALSLCNRCPALEDCRAWFATLKPRQRPGGVIAGRIHHWHNTTPKDNT